MALITREQFDERLFLPRPLSNRKGHLQQWLQTHMLRRILQERGEYDAVLDDCVATLQSSVLAYIADPQPTLFGISRGSLLGLTWTKIKERFTKDNGDPITDADKAEVETFLGVTL
jgi:hypothetical protein